MMFKRLSKKTDGLILLNDETIFMPQHRGVRLPVRVDQETAKHIIHEIRTNKTDNFSCLNTITAEWIDNKLVINATYNPRTKCQPNLYTKSRPIKTGICIEKICSGKCVDIFMRDVIAKRILTDLYKQR